MKKALVLGGRGFVGAAVAGRLRDTYDLYTTCVELPEHRQELQLDLTDKAAVTSLLRSIKPNLIVNCAGIVSNDERARLNGVITQNILEAVVELAISPDRIITMGSAAEYGEVDRADFPISEDYPISPTSIYGKSKADEVKTALKYAKDNKLNLTIVRLFNPIGPGMNERMLIPSLLRQLRAEKDGLKHTITVNRLDAERDFIDVRDVASAIKLILGAEPRHDVYNIGSGEATSISDLVEVLVHTLGLTESVAIQQSSDEPEPTVASQADITRLSREFSWAPQYTLDNVIAELTRE